MVDLTEIRRLLDAATARPWEFRKFSASEKECYREGYGLELSNARDVIGALGTDDQTDEEKANAALIVVAVNAAETMANEIDRLRSVVLCLRRDFRINAPWPHDQYDAETDRLINPEARP